MPENNRLAAHVVDLIRFDIDSNSGIRCPASGIEINFQDENITDYIQNTFVIGVFLSMQPDECAIGGELSDKWTQFYAENSDDMDIEEMISKFPGPYKAIEVSIQGMACGPLRDTAYYVVPKDSAVELIPRRT